MLSLNLARRLFFRSGRAFSDAAKSAPKSYGCLDMPDKMYKTIELEMKSAEPEVLKSYQMFISTAAKHLNVNVGKIWTSEKPKRKRWSLLKSVHIYKKHMVQYEVRTYYRWMQLHKLTGSTADTFLEYIERMLPEGVGLKVTKLSIEPIPPHICKENIDEVLNEQKQAQRAEQ